MAKKAFVFKSNLGTTASTSGSFLQPGTANIGTDDSSAFKADGYTLPPVTVGSASFLSATPTNYGEVLLEWGITSDLSSVVGVTPSATELVLVYSAYGPPQTYLDGQVLVTITSANTVSSFTHDGLTGGTWAYYSLFVKYQATGTRSWYERVASTEVLVVKNYNSLASLYRRIPMHYRLLDDQLGLTNINSEYISVLPPDLVVSGPLRRMLDVFGWDIDVLKTTIDYVIRQKDPYIANSEMLEQLAKEIGLPIETVDLGPARLRDLISNFKYLTENEGLITGIEEYITALAGSDTEVTFSNPDLFTATQHAISSLATTTSPTQVPTTNQWLMEVQDLGGGASSQAVAASSTYYGKALCASNTAVRITSGAASVNTGVYVGCLKTKITNVSQASRLYMEYGAVYGATPSNGASVIGAAVLSSVTAASAVSFSLTTGASTSLEGFVSSVTDGQANAWSVPVDFGVVGNGSITTSDMYLHIWVASRYNNNPLHFVPIVLKTQNRYPYYIDVYSQRLNLVRDPQFVNGISTLSEGSNTTSYWRVAGSSITGTSVANKVATISTSASSTLTLSTDVTHTTNGKRYTPLKRGVEYYFSIDDINDNISAVQVRLDNAEITLVTQSTVYRSENLSSGGKRKYWQIVIPSTANTYPESANVYHIALTADVSASNLSLKVSRPLLEPYAPRAYFDGDTEQGGWLGVGSGGGGANADHRWGDSSQHSNFSYYTSDYRRTVETVKRLMDYIVPVTEQTTALANLRFDRIPGYSGTLSL